MPASQPVASPSVTPPTMPATPGSKRVTRALALAALLACSALAACDLPGRMERLDAAELEAVKSALGGARRTTDAFGYPVDTLDRRVFTRWLTEGKYDSLTGELAARWESTRRDVRYEGMLYHAYEAFYQGSEALEGPLAKWRNAQPGVAEPMIAQAYYRYGRAVEARGGRWAASTAEEQFDRMRDQASEGFKAVERALIHKPGHLIAHSVRLNLLRLAGPPEDSEPMAWVQEAVAANPTSFLLRDELMTLMQPRWGGDIDVMKEFAEAAKEFTGANPKLKILEGRIPIEEARMEHDAVGSDYGMQLALLDQASFLGEDYILALAYAHLYEHHDMPAQALEAYQRARAFYPQGRTMLASIGPVLLKVAVLTDAGPLRDSLFAESRRAMALVRELRLPDEDLSHWERKLELAIPRCAKAPSAPCARIN
jgi:tetratricopeptide (TPR) repeat protein